MFFISSPFLDSTIINATHIHIVRAKAKNVT